MFKANVFRAFTCGAMTLAGHTAFLPQRHTSARSFRWKTGYGLWIACYLPEIVPVPGRLIVKVILIDSKIESKKPNLV
jgi:hypothetical protein